MANLRIPFDSAGETEAPDHNLRMRALLGRHNDHDEVSITWVELDGRHGVLRSGMTTRIYFVVSGSFVFDVEGDGFYEVGPNGVLAPEPLTCYGFSGRGEYLVINVPTFSHGDDAYRQS